ncbi:conjugative transposon protein TraN [Hymenobacter latericus]|uniref:conjugative transposon protein TraN n=1 Tax=Hymenobacter sp. YIM 151858-1 TaxID=2987688 RepID=UPI002227B0B3|nr:conjugative transposon protein TraN [Hymenobacter sp. YIM 151858-1]UYZ61157.1 conjugative transposon protein TraN [Hymenobacter sp. YIM 151858-1]
MTKRLFCLLFPLLLPAVSARAQQPALSFEPRQAVPAYRLGVGLQKTTHLVFPYAVTYVDLGSGDIIAARAESATNIVKVKASRAGFAETNMTVLAADGKLYSFLVHYERNPRLLTLDLGAGSEQPSPRVQLRHQPAAQPELERAARLALAKGPRGRGRGQQGVQLQTGELYTDGDSFFLPLHARNTTRIPFDVDFVRFYLQDRRRVRRTAAQQRPLQPYYVYNGGQAQIAGNGQLSQVFVLRRFTFPASQHLVVELYEKGGGRHVTLPLSYRRVLRARRLPGRAAGLPGTAEARL